MMPVTQSRSSKTARLLSLAILGITILTTTPAHAESDFVKNLVGKWSSFKRWICNDDRAPENPVPATTIPEVKQPYIAPQDRLKSEGELRRYVECYLTEDGRYDKVAKEYMPLIAEAARAFELPKTVLACLIFRESRFDINARSSTGAIGLGQHLTGTMGHISDVLKTSKEKETEKLLEITKLSAKESAAANKTTVGQAQKDLAYANTVLKDRAYRLRWEQLFKDKNEKKCRDQSRKPLPAPKPAKPRTDRKGNPIPAPVVKAPTTEQRYQACLDDSVPRTVNTSTIKNPAIAISATAMYLHMIIDEFKRNLDSDIKVENLESQGPNYNVLLAAAGAYNMGPGAAIKILSPIEPPDREKWVQALMKSNEETAGHVASIRNCIESSESPKGNAWLAPIGSHNYDCMAQPTAAQPRTVVGKSTLAAEYQNSVKTASMKPATPKAEKTATAKSAATKPAAAKSAAASGKPKASTGKAPASTSSKNGTRK